LRRVSRRFGATFEVDAKIARRKELEAKVSVEGFWDNPEGTEQVLRERKGIETFLGRWAALSSSLDDLRAWPVTPVLTIQNGVGAEDLVATARPGAGHIAGSLTAPVERPGAREVRWRGRGGIALAPVAGPVDALVDELVAAFSGAGLPARRLADARAMKWSKLVANLVGNALSALADRDPAEIYADPALFELERRQLLEALAVMRAQGSRVVALPGANVPLLALGVRLPAPISRRILGRVVGGARGGKSPSLRLHLRGGAPGPSEVAWLNGAVARAGARSGVPTPVNDALAALVDAATVDPELAAALAAEPARIVDFVDRPPRPPR